MAPIVATQGRAQENLATVARVDFEPNARASNTSRRRTQARHRKSLEWKTFHIAVVLPSVAFEGQRESWVALPLDACQLPFAFWGNARGTMEGRALPHA